VRRLLPRHPAVAAALGALAVALGACGVPVDQSPTALPRNAVPFGLLQPSAPSTTTATTVATPAPVTVKIFLVTSSGRLTVVGRQLPVNQQSLAEVLDALLRGPTNAEVASGLQSAVPPQTTVLGAVLGAGGVATVNLGGTLGQLVGQAQIEAVAQIVFTATALPGVTQVAFQLQGQAIDVPIASGAQVAVVNRQQFASLAPLPSGTTT
jgi:spore germination protein GerM